MATGMVAADPDASCPVAVNQGWRSAGVREPDRTGILLASALIFVLVLATRWPAARPRAFDLDEMGYLDFIQVHRFPPTHTLFLAAGRVLGESIGDAYRGFILLDLIVSAGALTACWWWLRSLTRPATAAAATIALGVSPIVWAYGSMAANYTAIVLVGSILLGIAWRGRSRPEAWHPYAAAFVLALGTGYRQDIGTLWLPVFLLILWPHRRGHAVPALALFVLVNLAWMLPMLHDVGGWHVYRAKNREFAYKAGYLNSVWHLGIIDGPVRYAVKAAIALALTFGPGLLFVPRGLSRSLRIEGGGFLVALLALSMLPALGLHLLVHFGVPGYGFHYVPALMALIVLGIGRSSGSTDEPPDRFRGSDRAPLRLGMLALLLAGFFWFYPTDYQRGGLRGDFDLAFARYTRVGLKTEPPLRVPSSWRTMNSEVLPGGERTSKPRTSLGEVLLSIGSRPRP